VNVERYLRRIGFDREPQPDLATLAALQRLHTLAVPFENLDIHLGRRLLLDRAVNYEKIVERGRGGWCFELNGLFGWLLEQVGFDVTLLGSQVHGTDWVSQDLAHLLLRVDLDQPYIVDVGFGDGWRMEPLALHELPGSAVQHLDGLSVHFTLQPRLLEEFQSACDDLQTSPESGFVRTRVAHRALPDGRISLRERVLIEEHGGARSERELADDEEWHAVLRDRFGIVLDA
jgi:N-hydroxyarylamine O-acetyltransferase